MNLAERRAQRSPGLTSSRGLSHARGTDCRCYTGPGLLSRRRRLIAPTHAGLLAASRPVGPRSPALRTHSGFGPWLLQTVHPALNRRAEASHIASTAGVARDSVTRVWGLLKRESSELVCRPSRIAQRCRICCGAADSMAPYLARQPEYVASGTGWLRCAAKIGRYGDDDRSRYGVCLRGAVCPVTCRSGVRIGERLKPC